MATVWLDILTPKQFWYFRKVGELLKARGHRVIYTSRYYEQLQPFFNMMERDEFFVVGEFGGADLRQKLVKSVERTAALLQKIDDFDCAVSSGSPEASRIAYGLAIPHVLASDTPESPVNKLAAPLSTKVVTPWILGSAAWRTYGVKNADVITYKALDPAAWLKDFKPDTGVLRQHDLRENDYILIRSPEYKAAYLRNSEWNIPKYAEFIVKFVEKTGQKAVVLPRYSDEVALLKKSIGVHAVVLERPVTDLSLLYYSKLFVGGGGTMTQEAALLGIPTISIYPGKPPKVIRYLIMQQLVQPVKSLESLTAAAKAILRRVSEKREKIRSKAEKILEKMENPAEKVAATVEALVTG